MKNETSIRGEILTLGVALTISYILLYQFNASIIGTSGNAEIAALVFLPAFVRFLGFLLIGLWAIPFLWLAAALSLNFEIDLKALLFLAACLELGAPLSLALFRKAVPVHIAFEYITGRNLLALSLVAAFGSAVSYHIGLSLVGVGAFSVQTFAIAVVGNAAGTWVIFYAIKIALTAFGKMYSRRG